MKNEGDILERLDSIDRSIKKIARILVDGSEVMNRNISECRDEIMRAVGELSAKFESMKTGEDTDER